MEALSTKLRSERESKKLTLDDVSAKTKIRPHIIKAFEDGNFSVLPPVYAKSFIIEYAKFLKIPISEIQEELDELFRAKVPTPVEFTQPLEKKEKDKKKATLLKYNYSKDNRTWIVNFLIYLVIAIAFVLSIYFSFFDKNGIVIEEIVTTAEDVFDIPDTAVIQPDAGNLFSFYEEPDSIILQAKAMDSAWLKINIDGKISEQTYMRPNLEKRWSAEHFFILTLGNAGAVEFRRNGELLPPLGGMGKVVRNVKITATEVLNSSNPWGRDSIKKPKRKWRKRNKKKIDASKILQPSTIEKTTGDAMKNLSPSKNEFVPLRKRQQEKLRTVPLPIPIPIEKKKRGENEPPKFDFLINHF